jgi:hypothetical protein
VSSRRSDHVLLASLTLALAPNGVACRTTGASSPSPVAPGQGETVSSLPVSNDAADARSDSGERERLAGPPCPPPEPRGPTYPPWELDHHFDRCIRGPEGRWSVDHDSSEARGKRSILSFTGADEGAWTVEVVTPVALARRTDGHVVVVDVDRGVTLVSPQGSTVWRSSHPECGSVAAVAVGWDHGITIACGYSVTRLDADGRLAWQVWPFGDFFVGSLWVDRSASAFVSGGGRVARLDEDGQRYWSTSTGFNRAIGRLVWNAAGNLVFDTSMAELHSNPEHSGGYRFYYEFEPRELFELTRRGEVVRSTTWEHAPPDDGWPSVLGVPADGSHRSPHHGRELP